MDVIRAGENFLDYVLPSGVTVVHFTDESSKCGNCVRLLHDVELIANNIDDVRCVIVNLKTYPLVRAKYGFVGNYITQIYKDGKFLKQYTPGAGGYEEFCAAIAKAKAGQPIDSIFDLLNENKSRQKHEFVVERVPVSELNKWVAAEENKPKLLRMPTHSFVDPTTNEWVIIYIDISG